MQGAALTCPHSRFSILHFSLAPNPYFACHGTSATPAV
jgi:hypothetical protein